MSHKGTVWSIKKNEGQKSCENVPLTNNYHSLINFSLMSTVHGIVCLYITVYMCIVHNFSDCIQYYAVLVK